MPEQFKLVLVFAWLENFDPCVNKLGKIFVRGDNINLAGIFKFSGSCPDKIVSLITGDFEQWYIKSIKQFKHGIKLHDEIFRGSLPIRFISRIHIVAKGFFLAVEYRRQIMWFIGFKDFKEC